MLEMLKFGRRVVFDRQLSNKEVLESHINSIHEHAQQRRQLLDSTQREEREYIDKRRRDDDLREAEKQFYHAQLTQEYADYNRLEKANKDIGQMSDTVRRQSEKTEFFPFVSGELLEEHRKHLNAQMRSEIQ